MEAERVERRIVAEIGRGRHRIPPAIVGILVGRDECRFSGRGRFRAHRNDRDVDAGQCRRCRKPRHRRDFDAAGIDLGHLRPVAGQVQIGITRPARLHAMFERAGQAQNVALGRIDVGPPELLVEPRRSNRLAWRVEQIPAEARALADVGPDRVEPRCHPAESVRLDFVSCQTLVVRHACVFHDRTEISDGERARCGPRLGGQQLRHVRIGVERRFAGGHDRTHRFQGRRDYRRDIRSAKLGDLAIEPQLEGLGAHGREVVDHVRPGRLVTHQRLADVAERADRNPENDLVKLLAKPQRQPRDRRRLRRERRTIGVLEIVTRRLQRLAVLDLLPQRLRWPAVETLHRNQRIVFVHAIDKRDLLVDVDGADAGAVGGRLKAGHVVEERELDPSLLEQLIDRRADRIAHADDRLEEKRPLVGEEQAHQPLDGRARRYRRLLAVPAHIRENILIQCGHDRVVCGGLVFLCEELAEFVFIENFQPVPQAAILQHAQHHAHAEVGEDQRAPQAFRKAGILIVLHQLVECAEQRDQVSFGLAADVFRATLEALANGVRQHEQRMALGIA